MKIHRDPRAVIPLQLVAGVALWAVGADALVSVAAFLCFPFVEYAVHRWAFHGPASRLHDAHHKYPSDLSHFAVPPWVTAAVALAVALVSVPVAGGLLVGMCVYDVAHLACHGKAWFPFRRTLAKHHATHHLYADKNFSVSTPPLDLILCSRHQEKNRPPT